MSGAGVSDTVHAKPVQALTVEVLENGRPTPGVVVAFEGLSAQGADPNAPGSTVPGMLVADVAANDFVSLASATTDQQGRASVLVQLGTRAGERGVRITCSTLGLADTAQFTVRPGNSTQLIIGVRDTLVRVGRSFSVGAYSADRFRNARSQDTIAYQAITPVGTVNANGTVNAGQVGRGTVVSRVRGFEDSTHFTIVPSVTLTAVHDGADGVTRIVTLDLDGSNLKAIGPVTSRAFPSHSRTGDLIAYHQPMGPRTGIMLMDGSGAARVLVDATGSFWQANYPVFSADSAFVYFGGAQPSGGGVWRIGLDGSGATRLAFTDLGWRPIAVSPDGARIAYSRSPSMLVKSVATGDSVRIGGDGWSSSFSPDGQRVAYYEEATGAIRIVKVDGSASKAILAATAVGFDARLAWMPDGTWILTSRNGRAELVNAVTSEVIALTHLSKYRDITADP